MGWRGYIDDERACVFFWSQKAACTTLFNLLADNMAERPVSKKHFHTVSSPTRPCLEAIEQRGYRSVMLARHPVSRAISAYFNKFCLYRGQRLRVRDDLEPFAQDLHDVWAARTGADPAVNAMSFTGYLDTVAHLMDTRPGPRHPINGHWETQVPPWLAEQGFRYDHLVRVERLEQELAPLVRSLGMTDRLRHMNRTDPRPAAGRDMTGVPAHDVAAGPFAQSDFITPATMETLQRLYHWDFETLGYPAAPDAPLSDWAPASPAPATIPAADAPRRGLLQRLAGTGRAGRRLTGR